MIRKTVGFAPHEAVAQRKYIQSGVVSSLNAFKVIFKSQRPVKGYAQVLWDWRMLQCGSITGYFLLQDSQFFSCGRNKSQFSTDQA